MMHPLHHAAQQHVDLAEIGLHLARTPYQVHERLVAPGREPAPGPRHRPRHRGQGDLRAMPVPRPLPDPGRSMPLLAPVRTIPREPLLRPRANTDPTADARGLPDAGTADRSSLARHLHTVGSLICVFRAIDATDSPFRRKRRIDRTWGMPAIILPGPFRRRYKHHPVKTMTRSACSA